MQKNQILKLFRLSLIGLACAGFYSAPGKTAPNPVGEKGAQIYCFMRISGNEHTVSWNAAYEAIKRQKSSFFKTSPKHAAVMIIETVVQNPEQYKNCGNYLGDLFSPENANTIKDDIPAETQETPSKVKKGDRYSY